MSKKQGKSIISAVTFRVLMTLVILVSIFTFISRNTSILDKKPTCNGLIIVEPVKEDIDIRADYDKVVKEVINIAETHLGLYKYNNYLIDTLRGYDISKLENAKIVYELSDKLLNDLYKDLLNNIFTDTEKVKKEEFISKQISWIKEKEKYLETTKDSELEQYEYLINMTLDKCQEWANAYYGD